MATEIIAVIGATGKTGARVLSRLDRLGYSTRGLSRTSEIPFDWSDRSSWFAALQGVSAAYVTYHPDLAIPQAEDDLRELVDVARQQGVKHLVLLSGRGEDGAQRAENAVINSGLSWNIVRASWFMQNFSESFMLDGIQAGELVLPQPNATEPFIDVDDIADVAVTALTDPALQNQLFEVTGPELLTFEQCVGHISQVVDREIAFIPVPVDAYLETAKHHGMADDMAWLIHELFVNVLDGRNESVTNTVETILGRPARSFLDYAGVVATQGVWK